MNKLRGLVALSLLLFLLSSIGFVLLVIDDKNDLSSRASTGLVVDSTKPLVTFPEADQTASFNPHIWLQVEDSLYLNQNNFDTLRVLPGEYNSASISSTLGSEFNSKKLLEVDQVSLPGWSIEKYTYNLFGEPKKVNLWKKTDISVLEVGLSKNDTIQSADFISKVDSGKVLGTTTAPDESAKLATLVRPSVTMVLNHYCAELKFFDVPGFSLSGKVYPFCLTSVGTGFFISEDGLLATNGHIVKNLPKSALYYGISSKKLDPLLTDFLGVYFSQINKRELTSDEIKQKVNEAHTNKEVLYQVGGLIADLNQKNILKFQNETNEYYLQIGNDAAEITTTGVKEGPGVIKAKLVDMDYQEPNEKTGFTSSDVALLKAESGVYPGLTLGNIDDAVVGSNLQVVGFPSAAMGTGNLLDYTSISEPTFTKGVVSAIKYAKGNQKKLIQTDAIINHGNSGGPALLLNGKVVGVATYGVTAEDGSGSYNFLRDIQDVKDLVTRKNQNLTQGEVYALWEKGLNNYWLGYHKYSLENFTKLKELYPLLPSVDKYLQSSKAKIDTPDDNTPRFTHKQRSVYMSVLGTLMGLSIFSSILFWYLFIQKKKQMQDTSSVPSI